MSNPSKVITKIEFLRIQTFLFASPRLKPMLRWEPMRCWEKSSATNYQSLPVIGLQSPFLAASRREGSL